MSKYLLWLTNFVFNSVDFIKYVCYNEFDFSNYLNYAYKNEDKNRGDDSYDRVYDDDDYKFDFVVLDS